MIAASKKLFSKYSLVLIQRTECDKVGKGNLKVLIVSAEVSPYAKTGGLGDVAGSLPKALKKIGVDVRVVMPKYKSIKEQYMRDTVFVGEYAVPLAWRTQSASIYRYQKEVPTYFIQNEYYFGRDQLYGYEDDNERFAFFCKAVLEMLPRIGYQPDIIHCNDWQTGPVCLLLKEAYHQEGFYSKMKSLYTIHNLQYQGVFPKESLYLMNLSDLYYESEKVEYYGSISYMKAGILYADAISTVSDTYAKEIQTPQYGYGMEGVLQKKKHVLHGIVNGIDYDVYDPSTDNKIFMQYSSVDIDNKYMNKTMLQQELGLPEKDVPIIGLISRLADQKGFDIISEVIDRLMEEDIQFVVLGTGEPRYEAMFKKLKVRFPDKMSANISFDETLAQRIYAGSDLFLMPSLFEPCGLGQIFSLRYGTIPIVRKTGGLADTIISYDEITGKGNGFVFEEYTGAAMLLEIKRSLNLYAQERDTWQKLVKNAMECIYSWDRSAQKYMDLYNSL